jgi:hypothetical protein
MSRYVGAFTLLRLGEQRGGRGLLKRRRHNLERGYKQNHTPTLEGYIGRQSENLSLQRLYSRFPRRLPPVEPVLHILDEFCSVGIYHSAVVKQVHLNKEYVVLEKDGISIAALMNVDEFEDYLELQDPEVRRE